jgi:hypothetical protein
LPGFLATTLVFAALIALARPDEPADHATDALGQRAGHAALAFAPFVVTAAAERAAHALGPLGQRPGLHSSAHHAGQVAGLRPLVAPQVQPLDAFRVAEVSVDAGDDDAQVHGQQLDADQRHPHERVDHNSFVEDQVQHVIQSRRRRRPPHLRTPAARHHVVRAVWVPPHQRVGRQFIGDGVSVSWIGDHESVLLLGP